MGVAFRILILALGWIAFGLLVAGSITLLVMAVWIRRIGVWQQPYDDADEIARRIELR